MTATQTHPTEITPVAGPKFRAAARRPIEGAKRRKLVALVAAYEDGGAETVSVAQLAERLDWNHRKVQALVQRLEADGFLMVVRRRKKRRYRLADPAESS